MTSNEDDRRDIKKCLAGDAEAFNQLVLRHQDRLFRTLCSMLGREDARDIAQEAFVSAYRKLGTFRRESAFYSWLFRIAYNAAISLKRKRREAVASVEAMRDASGVEPDDDRTDIDPGHRIDVAEQQVLVRQALDQLADEFRIPLVLKEMEGMKYEEIAEMIGCPIGTVRSRIHRGRSELRERLRMLMPEEVPEP